MRLLIRILLHLLSMVLIAIMLVSAVGVIALYLSGQPLGFVWALAALYICLALLGKVLAYARKETLFEFFLTICTAADDWFQRRLTPKLALFASQVYAVAILGVGFGGNILLSTQLTSAWGVQFDWIGRAVAVFWGLTPLGLLLVEGLITAFKEAPPLENFRSVNTTS